MRSSCSFTAVVGDERRSVDVMASAPLLNKKIQTKQIVTVHLAELPKGNNDWDLIHTCTDLGTCQPTDVQS